ncbi:hypothetical protein HPP92_001891 [Vanilla planifolia]|uniref:SANT domain-containing protein n=1 Tax=Vanilla planifolia TaxID=51239 RepID=A0A835VIE9_VANPL|nr:hypothetical protein HPP92_001891 [Vanilla planifolia]
MDAYPQDSDGLVIEACADPLLSSTSTETNDIYEEDALLPRIGDQYQVKIPPLEKESKLQLRLIAAFKMPAHVTSPGIELSIPIMWVCCAGDNINIKCENKECPSDETVPLSLQNNDKGPFDFKGKTMDRHMLHNPNDVELPCSSIFNVEFPDLLNCSEDVPKSANYDDKEKVPGEICSTWVQVRKNCDRYPLPGSSFSVWKDAEIQSFLLGLYIFGKNLVQKKFVASKSMGDILSFYYGKFFNSNAHRRWSESRKTRSKRFIHGPRLFSGWRKQEFLSRVLPSVTKEVQPTLLEVAKTFSEGMVNLEEFVFTVKDVVGIQVLVEAIGIGKGKHDLTEVVLDSTRRNHPLPLRPEIPVGKACSSLTSGNIIKFLTGDFRLSKAKSNDLFWEAVWPRLLANEKSSQRASIFFDSVRDVLSKVASNPGLLELDVEAVKRIGSTTEHKEWDADPKIEQDISLKNPRHCYLRPRIPYCNSELMRFTVVDTSMARGEQPFKLGELRSLPVDAFSSYNPAVQDSETQSSSATDVSISSSDNDDSNCKSFDEKKPKVTQTKQRDHSTTSFPLPDPVEGYVRNGGDFVNGKIDENVPLGYRRNKILKYGSTNCSFSTSKRRRLTNCSTGTSLLTKTFSRRHKVDKQNNHCATTSRPMTNPSVGNNFVNVKNFPKCKLQPQTYLDLNNLPPDSDLTELSCSEVRTEDHSHSSTTAEFGNMEAEQASSEMLVAQHPSTDIRRHSKRNRPPTARALEALACGFLGTKKI